MESVSIFKLISLIVAVVVSASIKNIIIPILVTLYPSIYFIVLFVTIECCLLFFCVSLIANLEYTFEKPTQLPLLIAIGITSSLVTLLMSYSANPKRTPVILQSIFLGLAIIPCAIFSKIILKKQNEYDMRYLIASIFILILSVTVATIPIATNNEGSLFNSILWSLMYLLGIVFLGLSSVLQEKYIILTDSTFKNKIRLAFYSFLFQTITILLLCWVDIIIGYADNATSAFKAFIDSFYVFGIDELKLLLLQLFVCVIFVLVLVSIYLNAISTNYNMILTNVSNQIVALFFTIFPSLNSGIQYPLWIIIVSLLLNIISVILWIKGESIAIPNISNGDENHHQTENQTENQNENEIELVEMESQINKNPIIDENTKLLH